MEVGVTDGPSGIRVDLTATDSAGGLRELYRKIAKSAGLQYSENTIFNEAKLRVSHDVLQVIYKFYRDSVTKDHPDLHEQEIHNKVHKIMINSGLRVDPKLKMYSVRVFDDFVIN